MTRAAAWVRKPLRGTIHVKHGFPFKSEFFAESGQQVVLTPGNFHERGGFKVQEGKEKFYTARYPAEYLLGKGDLIVAMTEQAEGLLGSAALVPEDGRYLHNQRIGLVTSISEEVVTDFLCHLFKTTSVREQISNSASGSKVRHTSPERIYQVEALLPPAVEQKKIAKLLSTLDAKIDLNNRINAELEALAKTIYDYWFVQFDFPDDHGRPYKTSGGPMAYNPTLKREIPAGWGVQPLSAWIAKQKNGDWGAECAVADDDVLVTCIRGTDINALNGRGELKAPMRYIATSRMEKHLAAYDLIVEISGGSPTQSTGRAALVGPEVIERFNMPLVCSNFCKALSLKDTAQAYPFLQQWNSLHTGGVFFGWEGKTSGIKNLQFDSFVNNYFASVPPNDLSRRFHDLSTVLDQKKQCALGENRELTQLRDWLLPLLMNGQVRVGS